MKVIFTSEADNCLSDIYLYHREYSYEYAVGFQTSIEEYLTTTLSDNPKLGRHYNHDLGIRRLVYKEKYNVYYVIKDNMIYVIFIYDGQMDFNQQIERGDIDMPPLDED
jgi:plasmid stabilization system protein ParE